MYTYMNVPTLQAFMAAQNLLVPEDRCLQPMQPSTGNMGQGVQGYADASTVVVCTGAGVDSSGYSLLLRNDEYFATPTKDVSQPAGKPDSDGPC